MAKKPEDAKRVGNLLELTSEEYAYVGKHGVTNFKNEDGTLNKEKIRRAIASEASPSFLSQLFPRSSSFDPAWQFKAEPDPAFDPFAGFGEGAPILPADRPAQARVMAQRARGSEWEPDFLPLETYTEESPNPWLTWLDPNDPSSPQEIAADIVDLGWDEDRINQELDPRNAAIRMHIDREVRKLAATPEMYRDEPAFIKNREDLTEEFKSGILEALDDADAERVIGLGPGGPGFQVDPGVPTEDAEVVDAPPGVTGGITTTDTPATDTTTGVTPTTDIKTLLAGEEELGTKDYSENLRKIFYQRMDEEAVTRRSDIRNLLPRIMNDTEMLFLMSQGREMVGAYKIFFKEEEDPTDVNVQRSMKKALTTLTEEYAKFLNRYIENPESFRSGSSIRQNASKVSRILSKLQKDPGRSGNVSGVTWTDEERADADWVEAFFSGDIGTQAAQRRQNLINLSATNGQMGSYSQQIHRTLENLAQYHRNRGMPEAEIMAFVTRTGPGTLTIESPTDEARPSRPPGMERIADDEFMRMREMGEFDPALSTSTPAIASVDDRVSTGIETPEEYARRAGLDSRGVIPTDIEEERIIVADEGGDPMLGVAGIKNPIAVASPYQFSATDPQGSYIASMQQTPGYSAAFEEGVWSPMDAADFSYLEDPYEIMGPGASFETDFDYPYYQSPFMEITGDMVGPAFNFRDYETAPDKLAYMQMINEALKGTNGLLEQQRLAMGR